MVVCESLGLHEPSALPHLVAESILPPNPPETLYRWLTFSVRDDTCHEDVEEELLITQHCVAWSQSRVVKRIFNLQIEGEPISHAFMTRFPVSGDNRLGRPENSIQNGNTEYETESLERGLVVILKTQIHVFLVSGGTYVVPLSFEVDHALPAPCGFVLQRRMADTGNHTPGYGPRRPAPMPSAGSRSRQEASVSLKLQEMLPHLTEQHFNLASTTPRPMPGTYSFTDTLSELGLVVSVTGQSSSDMSTMLDAGRPLGLDERIIYLSTQNELKTRPASNQISLWIAVTSNRKTGAVTLWKMLQRRTPINQRSPSPDTKHRRHRASMRKRSNVYSRTTSGVGLAQRETGRARESFGGVAQSYSENVPFSAPSDPRSPQPEDLTSQLGQGFEEVGVQTRSARRVSSMLARTDLSIGNDRNTFTDLATGHAVRKSLNRSMRRGESTGSVIERQSFGTRGQGSMRANESVLSYGTSFLDVPAHHFLRNMQNDEISDEFNENDLEESASELPRNLLLLKIDSFARAFARTGVRTEPNDYKVFSLTFDPGNTPSSILSICIMDKTAHELAIVYLTAEVLLPGKSRSKRRSKDDPLTVRLNATDVRTISNIEDACKIEDGHTSRILVLRKTRDGAKSLQLEAPWSTSFTVDLPSQFAVYRPFQTSPAAVSQPRRDIGANRIIPATHTETISLSSSAPRGEVTLVDHDGTLHRLQLRLEPRNARVVQVLSLCSFLLPAYRRDDLMSAWWEVSKWLRTKAQPIHSEWLALVVTLFTMVLPFVSSKPNREILSPRRKKGTHLRSGSSTTLDTSSWETMDELERSSGPQSWIKHSDWKWVRDADDRKTSRPQSPIARRQWKFSATGEANTEKKDGFIVRCSALAREFLQTPFGEYAIGPEGYLPIAVGRDRELRRTAIPAILVGLHLLREEQKLDILSHGESRQFQHELGPVLAQMGQWLGWEAWTWKDGTYYNVEIADVDDWLFEETKVTMLEMPPQPFEPPSIFACLESIIHGKQPPSFPTLLDVIGHSNEYQPTHPVSQFAARTTPKTLALLSFMAAIRRKQGASTLVDNMLSSGIERTVLESLPDGVATAFHHAIASLRSSPPSSSSRPLLQLLDRLDMMPRDYEHRSQLSARSHPPAIAETARDYHSIGNLALLETDGLQSWDTSSEIDRQHIAKLIFHEDRRFQEASKLVNQTRPPVVECNPEPDWSEADLLEAEKELVHFVIRRTLCVSAGRGMMHFNSRIPLLTEKVPIPAFSLQCVIQQRLGAENSSPMTFSGDKAAFTEDKVCWAFFHNGASAGLMISRDAKGIDTSWILYNKPLELTNRHAGFLLALGLNGHLKHLAKWVAFKYLTPKHTMTSIGLLMGLAASYRGTMDALITRLLSVHVTRLLPPGAAELNLSPLTQTTGILGIGLLYCGSQHRRMSEVMLSEIENNDPEEGAAEDTILRDEGYRLAAGFSLGLINLGQGMRLHSLHDMGIVERLLTIATGSKKINLVHVIDRATAGAVTAYALIFMKTNDESLAKKIDIPDTVHQFEYVRPDIFLLRTLARHLILWDHIRPSADFVQASLPKIYQKRATLKGTKYLSSEDMPFFNILAGLCLAIGLRFAGSQDIRVRDLLVQYLDQFIRLTRLPAPNYDARLTRNSVRNCQDVIALAVAAAMAGSGDLIVLRRLRSLHGRTDAETPYGSHMAAHMAIGALFLGGGTQTFGTSSLAVASLLCAFYPVFPTTVLDNKSHLQACRHLWVLAVENRCLVAREVGSEKPVSVPAQLTLRTGEVREIRAPGLLPDLSTITTIEIHSPEFWDVKIEIDDKRLSDFRKDPSRGISVYLRRRAAYDRPVADPFVAELQALDEASGIPSVNPTAAAASNSFAQAWISVLPSTALRRQALEPAPGANRNPLEWLFTLPSLRDLDNAEKALVLPHPATSGICDSAALLTGTVMDSRLEFESGILWDDRNDDDGTGYGVNSTATPEVGAVSRDKLWQLRLLFAWADRWDREAEEDQGLDDGDGSDGEEEQNLGPRREGTGAGDDDFDPGSSSFAKDSGTSTRRRKMGRRRISATTGTGTWLRREVIDRLRWRVWRMVTPGDAGQAGSSHDGDGERFEPMEE